MEAISESDAVLAALSAGGGAARFNPVQVQILQFLIERRLKPVNVGSRFHFVPCSAGPYAHTIYEVLQSLAAAGEVTIDDSGPYRAYSVSEAGRRRGRTALGRMPRSASKRAIGAARWVLSQPFWEMIAWIQRRYPEMVTGIQVPPGAVGMQAGPTVHRMGPFLSGIAGVLGVRRLPGDFVPGRGGTEQDAVASDWRTVGDDLRFAIERVHPTPWILMTDECEVQAPGADGAEAGNDCLRPADEEADRQAVAIEYAATTQYFGGPLPSPEHMRQSEADLPGSAERILALAERRAGCRRREESLTATANARIQAFGFVVALASILGGFIVIALDKPVLGAVAAITAIGGLTMLVASPLVVNRLGVGHSRRRREP